MIKIVIRDGEVIKVIEYTEEDKLGHELTDHIDYEVDEQDE